MNNAFAFERSVLRAIRTCGAIADGDRVLVAVSGGADSTALLAVLEALRRRGELPIELAVAHLNHHLRGAESDRDATVVAELARRFGLSCLVGDADLAGTSANREASARRARYAFLEDAAGRWRAQRIAVAHTRDDQAETVLLRLARGAGPASLAAMEPVRADGVIRPLLEESRAACVAYLAARNLAWIEDSSNVDETLFRNRVRRRLLPALDAELGVDVRGRLARFARQLRAESALAEQRIAELLGSAPPGQDLPIAAVAAAGAGAERLLHAWLARAGIRPSERQVESLLTVVVGRCPSAAIDLGSGARVVRRYEYLVLERGRAAVVTEERAADSASLAIPGSATVLGWQMSSAAPSALPATPDGSTGDVGIVLDCDQLRAPLSIRRFAPGDRVRLVYGRRKLADILIDAKVPRQERTSLPVVTSGEEVLWVPGIVRSIVAGPSAHTRSYAVLRARRVSIGE